MHSFLILQIRNFQGFSSCGLKAGTLYQGNLILCPTPPPCPDPSLSAVGWGARGAGQKAGRDLMLERGFFVEIPGKG
jgi:hypothetical protein